MLKYPLVAMIIRILRVDGREILPYFPKFLDAQKWRYMRLV